MKTCSALHGLRVVDLTDTCGGMAGRVLADLGAEVYQVEPPGGLALRRLPPFRAGFETNPNGSLVWAAVALGKRSVVLDKTDVQDLRRLYDLIAGADVLLEANMPGTMAEFGLDYPRMAAANPGLVYTSITPFGQTGPHAALPATDLTLLAAGGLLGLQGDGDRPPIPLGFPQAWYHAGVQAAADTLVALCERERSGLGQHLDVSVQAAVVWTLMNATGYPPNTGGNPPGTSEARSEPPPQLVSGLEIPRQIGCRDGSVVVGWVLPGIGERTFAELAHWVAETRPLDVPLGRAELSTWRERVLNGSLDVASFNRVSRAIVERIAECTKAELQALAVSRRLLLAPVYNVRDLLDDEQLAARRYWRDVEGTRYPGPFAKLSGTPIELLQPPPALGYHAVPPGRPAVQSKTTGATTAAAFDGLKVLDLAWVGVGPIISKALADHGATVVHVESRRRLDVLRQLPPFKGAVPGLDRSQFFANFNSSKWGVELDFADPNDLARVRELALAADVIVESFTPGTLARFGLDYETLAVSRPDLVMLSTCMRGQTGPERGYTGFGNQGAALAGLIAITGWPDRFPHGPWGAYTDFIAPRFGVAALAAAIFHRQTSREGQHIDLSQIEAGIHFLEPLVLDYTVNGRVAGAIGHSSPYAFPHGVFRTAGLERYVAIAAENDGQRRALERTAGSDIASWCISRDADVAARSLSEAGVPAYAVLRPADLYQDPQLLHRGFFVVLDHPVMGPTPYDGHATLFSRTPAMLRRPAPCLGQHSAQVSSLFAEAKAFTASGT